MDKGQHLRLFIKKGNPGTQKVIALATDMTFHVSATTENSTTKDSTDTTGQWDKNEVTALSYDIQISALIGYLKSGDSEDANMLDDIISGVSDNAIDWELAVVSGTANRMKVSTVAEGKGKLTKVNPTGNNRQKATYSATINGYGAFTVPS